MTKKMNVSRMSRRVAVGIALGIALAASVAYAATLAVTSSRITTSNTAVSIPPTTCTLSALTDSVVDRASQNSNYGNLGALAVRSQSGTNQRRSLVRFDIASCGIPATAVIRASQLTVVPSSGPASSRTYNVHRVTGAWNEATVTYANQPGFVAGATAGTATGITPATLSWSVSSDVSAFIAGTANNGWLIKDSVENAGTAVETVFGSSENGTAGNRPSLTITYFP